MVLSYQSGFLHSFYHGFLGITFDGLLVLSPPEEVNDVFWVRHALHILLTEARGVEGLEAAAVVHLEREREGRRESIRAAERLQYHLHESCVCVCVCEREAFSYSDTNKRLLWSQRAAQSFSFRQLQHLHHLGEHAMRDAQGRGFRTTRTRFVVSGSAREIFFDVSWFIL